MDWMATNLDLSGSWDSRPKLDDRTFTIKGAPAELMIELINELGSDMWISIPHAAEDEYISSLADLLKNTLRPDVKIYIEYSNEVWGTLFPGGSYSQLKG
jgi:hypothetical protein